MKILVHILTKCVFHDCSCHDFHVMTHTLTRWSHMYVNCQKLPGQRLDSLFIIIIFVVITTLHFAHAHLFFYNNGWIKIIWSLSSRIILYCIQFLFFLHHSILENQIIWINSFVSSSFPVVLWPNHQVVYMYVCVGLKVTSSLGRGAQLHIFTSFCNEQFSRLSRIVKSSPD